jgi:hypothetical protein
MLAFRTSGLYSSRFTWGNFTYQKASAVFVHLSLLLLSSFCTLNCVSSILQVFAECESLEFQIVGNAVFDLIARKLGALQSYNGQLLLQHNIMRMWLA